MELCNDLFGDLFLNSIPCFTSLHGDLNSSSGLETGTHYTPMELDDDITSKETDLLFGVSHGIPRVGKRLQISC